MNIKAKLRDALDMRVTELMSDFQLNQTQAQRLLAECLSGSALNDALLARAEDLMDNSPACVDTDNFVGQPIQVANFLWDAIRQNADADSDDAAANLALVSLQTHGRAA